LRGQWDGPVGLITTEMVKSYRAQLIKRGLAANTLNQYRAIVRGIFTLAVEDFGLEVSPADGFQWTRSRRASSGSISFYRPDQVLKLAEHAGDAQDAAIFITAAFTGLRAGELRSIRWRWIDFSDSLIHVERGYTDEGGEDLPKSYKVRSMPLMPQVATVLLAARALHGR
jgi:integrase